MASRNSKERKTLKSNPELPPSSETPIGEAPIGESPRDIAERIIARRKDMESAVERRANSKLVLEFSDHVVIVRDGVERIIERIGLSNGWTARVGEIMEARGCKEIGSRISENARFSIRETSQTLERQRARRGGVPSMQFDGEEF